MEKQSRNCKLPAERRVLLRGSMKDTDKEIADLQKEIDKLQRKRNRLINKKIKVKTDAEKEYGVTLPKSIFDFTDEQLDWLLYHYHDETEYHYKLASKYFNQFTGVMNSCFTEETKQFKFSICSRVYNDHSKKDDTAERISTLEFLTSNLGRVNGTITFSVLFTNREDSYEWEVDVTSATDMTITQRSRYREYGSETYKSFAELLAFIEETDRSTYVSY